MKYEILETGSSQFGYEERMIAKFVIVWTW